MCIFYSIYTDNYYTETLLAAIPSLQSSSHEVLRG